MISHRFIKPEEKKESHHGKLLIGLLLLTLLTVGWYSQVDETENRRAAEIVGIASSDCIPSQMILSLVKGPGSAAFAEEQSVRSVNVQTDSPEFPMFSLPSWLIFLVLFAMYLTPGAINFGLPA
jgi:hypothetical protein